MRKAGMKSRQTFAALLSSLMGMANLSARALATRMGAGSSRVSDWLATTGKRSRHYPEPSRLPDLLRALALSPEDTTELVAAYAHETGTLPVVGLSRATCRRLANRIIAARKAPRS
jgi:hypothetical protein